MSRNRSLCLAVLLGALATSSGVAEATVVYSDTVLARGPEFASSTELALGPGTYRVTATDLHWLNSPLSALSFGAFTATAPIKTMVGVGTLEFFYAGQGKLFLQVYARPAPGMSAALIGIQVTNAAVVALPASLWLLSSALTVAGIGSWLQRRARSAVAHAAALASLPRERLLEAN